MPAAGGGGGGGAPRGGVRRALKVRSMNTEFELEKCTHVLTLQLRQLPVAHRFRRCHSHPCRTRRCRCVVYGKKRKRTISGVQKMCLAVLEMDMTDRRHFIGILTKIKTDKVGSCWLVFLQEPRHGWG